MTKACNHSFIRLNDQDLSPLFSCTKRLANPASSLHVSCPAFVHPNPCPPSQPQTSPHISPDSLFEFRLTLSPHSRRIDIRRAFIVGLSNHAHHTNENLLHALYRRPSLRRLLVVVRVIARRVEDRDAYDAVGVDYQPKNAHVSKIRQSGRK